MNIKKFATNKALDIVLDEKTISFSRIYVFACTCKKTNPNANPKSVIAKQIIALVTISPIYFMFDL